MEILVGSRGQRELQLREEGDDCRAPVWALRFVTE